MRLFVGLVPPVAAAEELDAAARRLRRLPAARDLRWSARDGWHVTLAFLGDVEDDVRPALDKALAGAAAAHRPFRLRLAGGGRFGGSVLWGGLDGDRRALARLAADVSEAARAADAAPPRDSFDGEPFRPHLTLARARGRTLVNLRPLVDGLAGFSGSPWEAARIELISSVLGAGPAGGPRYETVATHPLGAAAEDR